MPVNTKIGNTAADFSETGINREFSERSFGGKLRANESMLAAIERTIEWSLWKRSLLDSRGTCDVAATGGWFRRDEGVTWNADFNVLKDGKKVGAGSFVATFDSRPASALLVLKDVHVKVYADQRERINRICGERD